MFCAGELQSSAWKQKFWFSLLSDGYNYTSTCNIDTYRCLQCIDLHRKVGYSILFLKIVNQYFKR